MRTVRGGHPACPRVCGGGHGGPHAASPGCTCADLQRRRRVALLPHRRATRLPDPRPPHRAGAASREQCRSAGERSDTAVRSRAATGADARHRAAREHRRSTAPVSEAAPRVGAAPRGTTTARSSTRRRGRSGAAPPHGDRAARQSGHGRTTHGSAGQEPRRPTGIGRHGRLTAAPCNGSAGQEPRRPTGIGRHGRLEAAPRNGCGRSGAAPPHGDRAARPSHGRTMQGSAGQEPRRPTGIGRHGGLRPGCPTGWHGTAIRAGLSHGMRRHGGWSRAAAGRAGPRVGGAASQSPHGYGGRAALTGVGRHGPSSAHAVSGRRRGKIGSRTWSADGPAVKRRNPVSTVDR